MTALRLILVLLIAVLARPTAAIEPEQREVTVISARVWEGHEYRETFAPSTHRDFVLMAGRDSAIAFVRTLEYYWPLSRQVYVDFKQQRDVLEGELVIRQGGREIAREKLRPFSVHYPHGAVRGEAELLWGEDAERGYSEFQENERRFVREFAAARRAHTEYERRLLKAARNQKPGEPPERIPPPPPLPEPSLRLVTQPQPGFRVMLAPGEYTLVLEQEGHPLPGTERRLRVVEAPERRELIADIVPEERWTRPLASNAPAARVYVRGGATFYMTLHEAGSFAETDYLPVVRPQAEAMPGRRIWVRRGPADTERLAVAWQGGGSTDLARAALKVEQTRGSSFGYRVRPAKGGERPDLDAFIVAAPEDASVRRGTVGTLDARFEREIIVVHPRKAAFALLIALAPIAGFLLWRLASMWQRPS